MSETISLKWKSGAKEKILNAPSTIMYGVARMTLDMTYPTIPMKSGEMRRSSMSAGVRSNNNEYWIGSYTRYATRVYNLNDSTTNWTTPGTNSQWYKKVWNSKKNLIIDTIVEREKLK